MRFYFTKENWLCDPFCHRHFGDWVTKISLCSSYSNYLAVYILSDTSYTLNKYYLKLLCPFLHYITNPPGLPIKQRLCNLLVPVLMSMGTRVCSRARPEKDPTMSCRNSPRQLNLSLSVFASNHPENLKTKFKNWNTVTTRVEVFLGHQMVSAHFKLGYFVSNILIPLPGKWA